MRLSIASLVVASALLARPVAAASGTVVDDEGRPIEGAEACLWTDQNTGFCAKTDDRGYYRLLESSAPAVRITVSGYLPETVAAVPQESPIVLRRAAALRVRVVDARTRAPVAGGTLRITYLSGKKLEGFPFNAAGMRVATLEPGSAIVTAAAEGFASGDPVSVTLVAGRETEATIFLLPSP